jgi:short-subunit dehydrogenase
MNRKTILITGASSGLGYELAIQYSNPHSRLILIGRNEVKLNKIANLCQNKGAKTEIVVVDVTDKINMTKYITKFCNQYVIDIAIACAGVSAGTLEGPESSSQVEVIFDTNINEEPARIALRESIEQLLKERLTLIAVLTSAGEAIALTNLTETVASLALSEQWSRNIPVIAARSWEFADDRGSTAHLVFGG